MRSPVFGLTIVLALLLPGMAFAADVAQFPDNGAVRRQLAGVIFAPTSIVLATPSSVYRNPDEGISVRFDVQRQSGDFYLLFTNEDENTFPIYSPGSYVIKRTEDGGGFVQVKIFLNGDPDSFVRIFPMGDRTKMDLYLYGFQMYNALTIPVSFKEVLTDPFPRIMKLTAASVDWSMIFPDRPYPEDQVVAGMVDKIRSLLPLLSDHDDGAMNAQGQFVYIKTLQALSHGGFNCSGFDKWIIDGLYEPQVGSLISIDELKKKHLDLRGNAWSDRYEATRDPYFGLDWTRNLAMKIAQLDDPNAGPTTEDVRTIPFFQYIPNVGYPIASLKFALYELAVENPGYFYLGSVNREYGSNPVLREHTHVVALFPYFDESGAFQVAVMERNLETGIESLKKRYPYDYIHLERVAASTEFQPPMP